MKILYIKSLIFGMLSFSLLGQDCVDCLNSGSGMLPDDMEGISKLTAGISCAAAVETPISDDPFAVSQPKEDICDCVINKNIDGIKEKSADQDDKYKRAYAKMMATRFAKNAERLSLVAHSISLAELDASDLANGGPCDINQQFEGLSCFGSTKFQKNFNSLFGPGDKIPPSCKPKNTKDLTTKHLTCYWRALGASSALGVVKGDKVTSKKCLDTNTLNLLEKITARTPNDLIKLSRFINKENGDTSKQFDFGKFDRFVRELGSPRRALKKMEEYGPQYAEIRRIINNYPEISGMFEGQGSFSRLKGIFSGSEEGLDNPEEFIKKHFTGAGNSNLKAIYQNMKTKCLDYQKDLDTLLCKEVGESYINNSLFTDAFVRDPNQYGEIDSLDEALACHEKYCKEGKIINKLQGYCRPDKSGKSLDENFNKLQYDFDNLEYVGIEGFFETPDGELGTQANICRFLVCDNPSKKKCIKNSKDQMNRAEDVLAELCPNGESKARQGHPLCSHQLYGEMSALAKIQAREISSEMVVMVEVPDKSKPMDSEGNYPVKKEYRYKDGFTEHFWGVAGENPVVVPLARLSKKAKSKGTGKKKGKNKNKTEAVVTDVASTVSSVVPKAPAHPSSSGVSSGASQSEQAQSLARAAIDMAKNATDFSERTARKIQKRLDKEATKVASVQSTDKEGGNQDVEVERNSVADDSISTAPVVGSKVKESPDSYRPSRKLPTSVTDINQRRPSSIGGSMGRAALPQSFEIPEGTSSGALGVFFPPSNQVLSIAGKNLPSLEPNLLSEKNIDPHKPFLMEVTIDGKVYKIEVKPFVYKGKLLHRPELDHLKLNKPELYRAIRKSPLFQEYLAFEKGQKVYKWNDVLKVLSKAETMKDNA